MHTEASSFTVHCLHKGGLQGSQTGWSAPQPPAAGPMPGKPTWLEAGFRAAGTSKEQVQVTRAAHVAQA
jgi:hypothetical protein